MSPPPPDPDRPTSPAGPTAGEGAGTAARRARQASRRGPSSGSGRPGSVRPASSGAAPASDLGTGAVATTEAPVAPGSHRPGRELDPDTLAVLEEERVFLLGSLDDLEREHDAGDVDDVDYQALKDDYTARAAAVIRSIDQRQAAFARVRPPRRRGRALAWVAALLVLSVGLGLFVANSSGRREAGESSSGDIRQSNRDLLLQATSRWSGNPPDFVGAIDLYDQVLSSQPANTEALTYKAWLLFLTSRQTADPADTQVLLARANELLDQAVAIDASYGDARAFRANVRNARGFPADALADLDAIAPGALPDDMSGAIQSLRAKLETQLGTAGASGPSGSAVPTTASP
jgi:hypothetical protein